MATLKINDEYSPKKPNDFSLSCGNCKSKNVTLEIEYGSYTSEPWCSIWVFCENCRKYEEIY